ncbi:hypothetical protein ACK4CS_00045 [Enterococcus gallinarum]|uniref:hypothetical protein n=1 Tax=Enterococcus TaxID=1350 RepID=UPI00100F978E|nr:MULTISPECIES: hypothetical protein [Enterococcus]NKD29780.1 hypothetical protein [Enterococcus casseliflavus]RXV98694.1 hypothetical protein CYQ16_05420 [Enterococcus faecalis]
MKWRLVRHPYGGWMIEYKNGVFGGWQKVNTARHYQWEPPLPAVFKKKEEATLEMAKLISKYS